MSKVNYSLSRKIGADGRAQVHVRFVGSRTEVWRGKTGIYIHPNNWDAKLNMPRTSHRDQEDISECHRVQRALNDLSRALAEKYNKDKAHGEKWLTAALSSFKWDDGGSMVNVSVSEFSSMSMSASYKMMVDVSVAQKVMQPQTGKFYMTTHPKIEAYEEQGSVLVRDFDTEKFADYMAFLRENYSLSENCIYAEMAKIRRWWRWCMSQDNTLQDMSIYGGKKKVYGTPYYLTKEQRDKLYEAKMPNRKVEITRDMFILQCFIGCRICDLVAMTLDNIHGDKIEYIARKTLRHNPQTISVPLHPTAKAIIEKYKGKQESLVPLPSNHQTYSHRLRKAIKVAGIDCMITIRDWHSGAQRQVMLSEVASSHMARRTFIGCLYENGFRESDICSLSGHKEGSLSIQRYRRVSDERKQKMIDSI